MLKKKYIISPLTTYDEEQQLFATKVGINGKHMPLHYTVWGTTAAQSRTRAEWMAKLLTSQNKKNGNNY